MRQNQNESSSFKYKVKKAIEILTEDVQSISDVQTWAEQAGVSKRWLCKAIKKECGKPPKVFLRKKRYNVLVQCLADDPELPGFYLAKEAGLSDEKALYKFLSAHYDTTLTQLREEVIKRMLDE